MKAGDLVMHDGTEIGIIEHVWESGYGDIGDSVDVDVWFEDGEFQCDSINLEVINELSDEQLDDVRGGMGIQAFSKWRAEVINGNS